MAKYLVCVEMVFPDDIHAEDIIDIAEQRLERKVRSIQEVGKEGKITIGKRDEKHGRKVRQ